MTQHETLDAYAQAVEYKPELFDQIFYLEVDPQYDFCPGGSLAVNEGDTIMPNLNAAATWVRNRGGLIGRSMDAHPAKTSHFDIWPVHCVDGTPGAEFHHALRVLPQDLLFKKGTKDNEDAYSAFDGQDAECESIEDYIRTFKKQRIAFIVGGLATDYCVKATLQGAVELSIGLKEENYAELCVYGLIDAMKAVNPKDGETAIEELKEEGVKFITTEQLISGHVLDVRR